MIKISFFLLTLLFSINEKVSAQVTTQADTTSWVESFREFRNAVYQNDRKKVKEFINFPIMNTNNEIWYLVSENNGQMISKIPNKIKPFTEKDFDKDFDKIFESKFINTILKIKTDELYKNKYFETIEFKEADTTYKMYAQFDNERKILSLNLELNILIKDEDGKTEDVGESSVIYEFKVISSGHIKFIQIRLAG
jgi:hypothetical protein